MHCVPCCEPDESFASPACSTVPFERENRYSVIKWEDAEKYLDPETLYEFGLIGGAVAAGRLAGGKQPVECVVVESDWPEYEPTWEAIQARVEGQ